MQPFEQHAPIPDLEQVGVPIISEIKEGPADIIPGVLPRSGQLVIAGETDVGKSLVALEICSALTSDRPLWTELEPTLKARRIIYILGEHYNEVIMRLWALTGLPMSDQVWLIGPEQLGYDKWLVAQGKPNPIAINKLTKWAEGADLVVFDPLSAFVTGIDSENDNIQMRLVLDTMSLITQSVGASCLVLAHQGKPIIGRDGMESSRKSYAIRGASAIEDAATNIFYMDRAKGIEAAAETRDSKIFILKKRKYKGTAPDEYRLVRDTNNLTHILLGNRPYVEVKKMETQAKFTRIKMVFPDMPVSDVVKLLASIDQVTERTIYNHLGYKT